MAAVAENLPFLTSPVTDSRFLEPEKVELASFEEMGQESLHGAANSDGYELIRFRSREDDRPSISSELSPIIMSS